MRTYYIYKNENFETCVRTKKKDRKEKTYTIRAENINQAYMRARDFFSVLLNTKTYEGIL